MDTLNAIATRRSTRLFKAKPVSSDDLLLLVEMALKAPSSGNLQDYRFIVVTDKLMIKELPDFCMDQMWISSAPAVIVVCSQPSIQKKWYGAPGDIFARQNAAAATQNILLAAHDIGLGSCWISGFNQEKIDEFFGATGQARVEAVIPIGYPVRKPEPKKEFELQNTLFFNSYGMDVSDWDKFNHNYSLKMEKKLKLAKQDVAGFSDKAKIHIQDITKKIKHHHKKLKEHISTSKKQCDEELVDDKE